MFQQYPDLLQLLMDARADSDDEDDDIYAKKLTNMEIIRTSVIMIAAGIAIVIVQLSFIFYLIVRLGYETTSSALGYVSYLLAINPAKQDQLYQEISDFYDKKPVSGDCIIAFIDGLCCFVLLSLQDASLYEASQSLSYADMVIQEAMRMYAPLPL